MATRRSLSIDADLDLTIDGRECRVWTEGDTLVVNAPSLLVARKLADGLEALERPPGAEGQLVAELIAAGVTVELRVRRASVARLGSGVTPNRLAELGGVNGRASLKGVAVAAWRAIL